MTVKETRKAYSTKLSEQQEAVREGFVASAGSAMGVARPGRADRSGLIPTRRRDRIKLPNPNWRITGPIGEVDSWFVDPVLIRNGSADIATPTNEAVNLGGGK
jgi:hypothetical protein